MKLARCLMLAGAALAGSALGCDDAGLALPPGFCASVFADDLGHARHLAVAANGDVYVNTWSSRETGLTNAPGGYIVALRGENGSGRAEAMQRFGTVHRDGMQGGGTGIAVSGEALYAEDAGKIVRYGLRGGALVPQGSPEIVLSGLPVARGRGAHSFVIAPDGALFVNSGSLTNSCQKQDRSPRSPGILPCPELELHGGIWLYDANKTGQMFSPAERFATGTRNAAALAIQPDGLLYAALQDRDGLAEDWPQLYSSGQSSEVPAEVFARVEAVDDFGWPYCYYDARQGKHVLAPEYGGDGGTKQGQCIGVLKRVQVPFPPRWAPSAMTFYAGPAFPHKYRGGAFVAFEAGFVAFVPFQEGRAAGRYEVFAGGFAGRPAGVAVGRGGALYVSDDVEGRIWRITYEGVDK